MSGGFPSQRTSNVETFPFHDVVNLSWYPQSSFVRLVSFLSTYHDSVSLIWCIIINVSSISLVFIMIQHLCIQRSRKRTSYRYFSLVGQVTSHLTLVRRMDEQIIIAQMSFINLGQVDIWFRTSADTVLLVRRTSASQISRQPLWHRCINSLITGDVCVSERSSLFIGSGDLLFYWTRGIFGFEDESIGDLLFAGI